MNIETLISSYKMPSQAVKTVKESKIALLVGISGAGKDTIKKELLKREGFREIISHTTRPPRANNGVLESNGVDYHFIDEDRARQMLLGHEFIEAKLVHGTVYGTSTRSVLEAAKDGVAITDIDVQGVSEYRAISDKVVAIFIIPPSYEEWITRLRRRYNSQIEFSNEWPKRRDSAIKELEKALSLPYYHCLINDDLDRAVGVATDIAMRPDTFTRKDDEARLAARDLLNSIKAS